MKSRVGLEDCVRCKKTVDKIELSYNEMWKAYGNKLICDECAKKINK